MSDIQLRPCPFCGKKAATIVTAKELEWCKHFEDGYDDGEYETCPVKKSFDECPYTCVVCDVEKGGCGASTGFAWSIERAIEKWNRRPPIVVLDDDLR